MNAKFVLNVHGGYVIPGTHRAILVDPELGHQEEGNAGGAFFGARCLGQHQVDNVFRQVMVSGGDEAFRTCELILAGSVGGECLACDRADLGSCAWFGQAHSTAPFTGYHLGQKQVLLFLGSIFLKHGDSTLGQTPEHDDRR